MPALDLIGNADAYSLLLSRACHRGRGNVEKGALLIYHPVFVIKQGLRVPDQQPLIRAKDVSRRLGFVVALDVPHPDIFEADWVSVVL